jgi:hypothetical protein
MASFPQHDKGSARGPSMNVNSDQVGPGVCRPTDLACVVNNRKMTPTDPSGGPLLRSTVSIATRY